MLSFFMISFHKHSFSNYSSLNKRLNWQLAIFPFPIVSQMAAPKVPLCDSIDWETDNIFQKMNPYISSKDANFFH